MDEALDFLRGRLDSLIEADRFDLIRGGVHIGGGDRTATHRRRLRIHRLPRGARLAQSSRLARPINCCGSCELDTPNSDFAESATDHFPTMPRCDGTSRRCFFTCALA